MEKPLNRIEGTRKTKMRNIKDKPEMQGLRKSV
jgi:hypothetical protein